MKYLLAFIFSLFLHSAYAAQDNTIDLSKLSAADAALLKQTAENLKTQREYDAANATLSTASRWSNEMPKMAEGFARALGVAAKELNVAVNDFMASDAGKLTAALIVWKVVGPDVQRVVWSTVGLVLVLFFTNRLSHSIRLSKTERMDKPMLFGLYTRRATEYTYSSFRDMSSEQVFILLCIYAATVVSSVLIVVNV